MSAEREPPKEQASLKPPPVFTPGIIAILAFGVLLLAGLWLTPDVELQDRWFNSGFILLLAVSPLFVSWRFSAAAGVRTLTLFSDSLRLPVSVRAMQSLSIPLTEINGLMIHSEGRRGLFLIGTPSFEFVYPLSAFTHPDEAIRFAHALQERLQSALPHGDRTVAALERESQRVGPALVRTPWVTWVSAGVPLVTGLVLALLSVNESPLGSLAFGALSPELVVELGQWWRLFTFPMVFPPIAFGVPSLQFLPSLTLMFYALALLMVGLGLERMIGPWRMALCVLGGSAAGGLLLLTRASNVLVVGGVAAVSASLAAVLYLMVQNRGRVPLGFRSSARTWIWAVAFGLLLVTQPDSAFDLVFGGAIVGVLTAFTVGFEMPALRAPVVVKALVVLLLGATVISWGLAATTPERPEVREIVVSASGDAERLNAFAWEAALDEDASPETLELAEVAARRSVTLPSFDQQRATVKDTLATVLYRRAKYKEAIEVEQDVLTILGDDHTASQLARFIVAAKKNGVTVDTSSAALSLSASLAEDGRVSVQPSWRTAPTGHVTVLALVESGEGKPKAVLRIPFSEKDEDGVSRSLDTPEAVELTPDTETRVLTVQKGGDSARVWRFAPRVLEYP
ncbi:MAG: hypothetical protein ACFB9M_02005 [Myxococcota bacterium]